MADKQSHLNGAYYGPSIPPSRKSYHRPGHDRGGCGCCGCLGCLFNCCCSCIFNCVLQIIISVVITVGILVLIFWLIFRPNALKFHVTDASLTQFNLTTTANSSTNLHYNLGLNISARNPNRRIGIYYDRIEANGHYDGQRFSTVSLTPFYQGHKNTSVLTPSFVGQKLVLLGSDGVSNFDSDKSDGFYSVVVKLNLKIRFKILWFKVGHFKPKVECDLKVPLRNRTSNPAFETTKCHYDF